MNNRQDFSLNWWQASVLVFLIAVAVRLATLNQMGKTWDEPAYVETGYRYIELARHGNFDDPFWYIMSDHPPLIRYVYGFAALLDIKSVSADGQVDFHYNYTFPRLVSVLLGSLSSVFIVLFGYQYFTRYIGFASGIIFSLIPFFVGLSQLATLESFMMFFFTGGVYFYMRYLSTQALRYVMLAGFFAGLSVLVKQSNVIIFPLYFLLAFLHIFYPRKKSVRELAKKYVRDLALLTFASLFIFFILWPMPLFHLKETWEVQQTMWVDAVQLPPPEVFFGRLMLVPFPYYVVMFLITTPVVLLTLSLIGMLRVDKIRTYAAVAILVWFIFPFLQSFYAFKQHGVRYIIELYAPFALLCGLGLSYIAGFFKKYSYSKFFALFLVVMYLMLVLFKHSPYYLDYFNEVVGGNKYVYTKQLFQMGWWGQGIGEAAYFIAQNTNKEVTVAVDGKQPMIVVPTLRNIRLVDYNTYKNADYVIVPYFNVVRLGFPEYELRDSYSVVYVVKVDGAQLVRVYKRLTGVPDF